jgi:hypothetical protein
MDTATQMDVLDKGKNYLTPDEGRQKIGLPPVEGGDVVLRQQQDFSLAALAKRDAQDDPVRLLLLRRRPRTMIPPPRKRFLRLSPIPFGRS